MVSEISELTGQGGGATDAVRAILKEGMEGVERRNSTAEGMEGVGRRNSIAANDTRTRGLSMIKEKSTVTRGSDSSPSRNSGRTRTTARSSTFSGGRRPSRDVLTDLRRRYARFKASRIRTRTNGRERGSVLGGIAEDVQFCGLYLCGFDTTLDEKKGKDGYEDEARRMDAERRRDAEDTFLGRVINCSETACGEADLGEVEL